MPRPDGSGQICTVTATDNSGLIEVDSVSLQRDATPPTVSLSAPPRSYSTTIPLSWQGQDALGVAHFHVDVSDDQGDSLTVTAVDQVSNTASAQQDVFVPPAVTKYHLHGSTRVAMRVVSGTESVVYYLHGDHLGSVSLTTDGSGAVVARQLYRAWGAARWVSGTLPTDLGYTGQRGQPELGLVFMHARYYEVRLGRWLSADTIVPQPGNPQSLNRFSYVLGNPLEYTDPSGHLANEEIMELFGVSEWTDVLAEFRTGGRLEGRWGFLTMLGKLLGPNGNGVTEMARLYASARSRPYGRFDRGYPLASDELLMTLGVGIVGGQLTLLEHRGNNRARPISALEAGATGDIWTSYHEGHEERFGDVSRGHGFMAGSPGHHVITFDPNNFDTLGAWLDGGGIVAGLIWAPAGAALGCVEVARSFPPFAIPAAQGAPWSELEGPFGDLVLDVGGLVSSWFDVIDLITDFREGAHFDRVQ